MEYELIASLSGPNNQAQSQSKNLPINHYNGIMIVTDSNFAKELGNITLKLNGKTFLANSLSVDVIAAKSNNDYGYGGSETSEATRYLYQQLSGKFLASTSAGSPTTEIDLDALYDSSKFAGQINYVYLDLGNFYIDQDTTIHMDYQKSAHASNTSTSNTHIYQVSLQEGGLQYFNRWDKMTQKSDMVENINDIFTYCNNGTLFTTDADTLAVTWKDCTFKKVMDDESEGTIDVRGGTAITSVFGQFESSSSIKLISLFTSDMPRSLHIDVTGSDSSDFDLYTIKRVIDDDASKGIVKALRKQLKLIEGYREAGNLELANQYDSPREIRDAISRIKRGRV